MGKKSRAKKERRAMERERLRRRESRQRALTAYQRYATNPLYKTLVDYARADQHGRRHKPLQVALQKAEAEARLLPIIKAQMEREAQWFRAVYRALPAPKD